MSRVSASCNTSVHPPSCPNWCRPQSSKVASVLLAHSQNPQRCPALCVCWHAADITGRTATSTARNALVGTPATCCTSRVRSGGRTTHMYDVIVSVDNASTSARAAWSSVGNFPASLQTHPDGGHSDSPQDAPIWTIPHEVGSTARVSSETSRGAGHTNNVSCDATIRSFEQALGWPSRLDWARAKFVDRVQRGVPTGTFLARLISSFLACSTCSPRHRCGCLLPLWSSVTYTFISFERFASGKKRAQNERGIGDQEKFECVVQSCRGDGVRVG